MVYFVGGDKSPLRLKGPAKAAFIVRIAGDQDPVETILFYQLNDLGGSRVLPIAKFDALGGVSQPAPKPIAVEFTASKFDSSSFELLPTQVLVPGEYCMLVRVANKLPNPAQAFCFGVDAPVN